MRNLIPILLAVVVLSSGCDPDGYSCNSEGCYADDDSPQYLTLEDCLSVCDEITPTPGNCGDLVSHEGYDYSTVQIGEQCWFAENCRYLPEVSPSSEGSGTDPYYYVYDYEGTYVAAAQATANYETYGVLYNWPAVMTEGICPSGWHIPLGVEFIELTEFLGLVSNGFLNSSNIGVSVSDSAFAMKSTSGWNDYNGSSGNGSNSSGFTGLPGGLQRVIYTWNEEDGTQYSSGEFRDNGSGGNWWSASESQYPIRLSMDTSPYITLGYGVGRHYGFSARCVRD